MEKDANTKEADVEKHAVLYIPFEAPLGVDQLEKMGLQKTPIGMFLCAAALFYSHLPCGGPRTTLTH